MELENIDKELEHMDNDLGEDEVNEVEKELSNLSLTLEYYNAYIVNRPEVMSMEHLYAMESEYKNIISLNSYYRTIAYDAFDINLESHISLEGKFSQFVSNVVEFIKKLCRWVLSLINKLRRNFVNIRRKLVNIVITLLKNNKDLIKVLEDIRNNELAVFNKEIDYKTIEKDIANFIDNFPGYYVGNNTLDDVLNYNGSVTSLNELTRNIGTVLYDILLEARTYVKRSSSDFDTEKLYQSLLKVKLLEVRDSKYTSNVKSFVSKSRLIDKKAKDVFLVNIHKDSVTVATLQKPSESNDEVLLLVTIPFGSSNVYNVTIRESKDKVSLDWLYKKIAAGMLTLESGLLYNRDFVTDLMDSYDKTMDLIDSIVDSPTISNVDEIKKITLFLNKNVFPIIYKGYINQYLSLVRAFNNRVKLLNLMINRIKEEASIAINK